MKNNLLLLFTILFVSLSGHGQKIEKYIAKGKTKKVERWILKGEGIDEDIVEVSDDYEDSDPMYIHPMVYASLNGSFDALDVFIEYRDRFKNYSDLVSQSMSGTISNGSKEYFELLLDEGADVNYICDVCGGNSLLALSLSYGHEDLYRILVEQGASKVNTGNVGLLHAAASSGLLKLVEELIDDEGFHVDVRDSEGFTPLFYAVSEGHVDVAKYLVRNGANHRILDKDGLGISHWAIESEDTLMIQWVYDKYGGLKETDSQLDYGRLIHMAVSSDNLELVEFVIGLGVNIEALNAEGQNALFMLIYTWDYTEELFDLLINSGLSIKEKDIHGKKLEYYAAKEEHKKLTKLIDKYKKH